jgi:hypothetical protein
VPFLLWRMNLPQLFPFGTVLLGFRSCSANPLVDCSSSSLPLHCLGALSIQPQEWRTFPSLPCHPFCTELLSQCGEGSAKFGMPESCQNNAANRSHPRRLLGRRREQQCRNTRIFVMLSLGAERPSRTDR